ncbi:hypothetical protein RJ639_011524 [Escallonia herrerae]|uniref:Uncharacterized protein n=1 Tax=Escallonia herrerae TaxID=1293975 RepID=A0AA89AQ34_9ASTE|nr:hypothetical protein RJ639_011524 [Escallonia herrerae]
MVRYSQNDAERQRICDADSRAYRRDRELDGDPSKLMCKMPLQGPGSATLNEKENVQDFSANNHLMIVDEIISEGIKVDEQMQVAAIVDKLPNSWKEFQKGLRHKQSELSIVNLMARLQIEEKSRKQDKKNEALANNTHANHANNHQGNGNAYGNGAKTSDLQYHDLNLDLP